MDNSGTSFIPKTPVRGAVKARGVRKIYIFTYISFIFFFGTLLATVGTFFYNVSIESKLSSEKARLAEERNSFNQADLERVRDLETRMNTAFAILDRKVSLHSLLIALEDTTLRSVQIVGLEYKKDLDNSLDLSLAVSTTNFNSTLFQREIFSGNTVLTGASITEVTFTDGVNQSDSEVLAESEALFTVHKKLSTAEIPYEVSAFTQSVQSTQELAEPEEEDADAQASADEVIVESEEVEVIGQ